MNKYYKMSRLTRILSPVAVITGLAGSTYGEDHIKIDKFLGWEKTKVTRTQPGVVYTPQRVLFKDACGNCVEGIGYTPRAAEIITGQCTTLHWNARDSIPGRAFGLLDDIGKGIERALSPRPATARPCMPYDRCSQMYIAPTKGCCDKYPTFGPNSRLEPIPAR